MADLRTISDDGVDQRPRPAAGLVPADEQIDGETFVLLLAKALSAPDEE